MNNRYKYPRTFHLPFSAGKSSDDKVLDNLNHFIGKEIVVTEKMDGENTTLYSDYYSHARSIDSKNHSSRDWIKAFHSEIAHKMGINTRICGENLYAKHSIEYNDLESYFYGFSLWLDGEWCCSWDVTKEHLKEIGIAVVPELWRGIFDEQIVRALAAGIDATAIEGFVMRNTNGFHYEDFGKNVAKYVRADHIQSDEHWMHQQVIPNKLKNGESI